MTKMALRNRTIDAILILQVLVLLRQLFHNFKVGYAMESWSISEFLINYQGGFVRRGLPGEIIFQLQDFGINPYYLIIATSFLAYVALSALVVFFFRKHKLPWLILPFIVVLGNPIVNGFWVRKDIIVILLFGCCIYLVQQRKWWTTVIFNLVFAVGLLSHEAMGFFTFPILALLFFSQSNAKALMGKCGSVLLNLLPNLVLFLTLTQFKGDQQVAGLIWDSWDPAVFPFHRENVGLPAGAVGALGWTMERFFSYPLRTLFPSSMDWELSYGIYAPLAWLLTIVVIFYVTINLDHLDYRLFGKHRTGKIDRSLFVKLLLLQFLTMFPFAVFCWDYGRLVFYWILSALLCYLLLKNKASNSLFPPFYDSIAMHLMNALDRLLPPNRGVLFMLCLIVGFSPFSWKLSSTIISTSLYGIAEMVSTVLKYFI